jgi:prepilin-type N-terminal cleavage/methylation domain-containing protein
MKRGFTLVELLTVLAVITLLVGLLVPSLNVIRQAAKEVKQKATITTIGVALTTFKNDYGDYPRSDIQFRFPGEIEGTGGATNLAEAMFGQDLQGFHPYTDWLASSAAYGMPNPSTANLHERKTHYLDITTVPVFKIGDLYAHIIDGIPSFPLARGSYVLCDVFPKQKITLADGSIAKAGSPILYYKANPSSRVYDGVVGGDRQEVQHVIYNTYDNMDLIAAQGVFDGQEHPLQSMAFFYGQPPSIPFGYIQDPRPPHPWPYRPDSYLLVTAGPDGIYGTADDINNFGF